MLLAPALAIVAHRARARAAAPRWRRPRCSAARVAAFFVTNPYFFLDLDTAIHQLRGQAELAGNQDKFGQEQDTGALYYLDSLLWGLGYVAAACAAAGAARACSRGAS